jgi:hypothetical protein
VAAGRTLEADCCGDAIDKFKHLLRRFIAIDLSGFYP